MKTKVGLVEISNSFSDSYYLPLSVGYLQAYFMKHSKNPEAFEFLDVIFYRKLTEDIVDQLKEAEIVVFSVYVWNFNFSLEVARSLKKQNHDVTILFGGPHVPNHAEKFLRNNLFVNIACRDEGETVFKDFLDNYHSKNWKKIPSISYLDNEVFIQNLPRQRIKDITTIPSPYLLGLYDKIMRQYPHNHWMALWETNRGCPFSCSFCDWGSLTKSRLYKFDMERIKKEIEWFARNKIEFIYCCDANFGILKERDLEIAKMIVEAKKKYGYPKSLTIHDTKNAGDNTYAIQKILHEAKLNRGVSIAFQSLDKTTLDNTDRPPRSLEIFKDLQKKFNRDGIETFTEILLGLPGETYNSFISGICYLIENGQHNCIRSGNICILPNAPMADPEYIKKHGLLLVEAECTTQHTSIHASSDAIKETQLQIIGSKTMPKDDWVKSKIFFWWSLLVYFDKLLQIPILLIQKNFHFDYKNIFELFMIEDTIRYPIISGIQKFFYERAIDSQNGGEEFCPSYEWLNMYWQADKYIFIELITKNKIEKFYKEAKNLLYEYLQRQKSEVAYLSESIVLNNYLIKKPFQKEDTRLQLNYNIWENYRSALTMHKIDLKKGKYDYHIDCTKKKWDTLDDWLREVVWYGSRQGAYLYQVKSIKEKNGSYIVNDTVTYKEQIKLENKKLQTLKVHYETALNLNILEPNLIASGEAYTDINFPLFFHTGTEHLSELINAIESTLEIRHKADQKIIETKYKKFITDMTLKEDNIKESLKINIIDNNDEYFLINFNPGNINFIELVTKKEEIVPEGKNLKNYFLYFLVFLVGLISFIGVLLVKENYKKYKLK